jgi:hypothetical protein
LMGRDDPCASLEQNTSQAVEAFCRSLRQQLQEHNGGSASALGPVGMLRDAARPFQLLTVMANVRRLLMVGEGTDDKDDDKGDLLGVSDLELLNGLLSECWTSYVAERSALIQATLGPTRRHRPSGAQEAEPTPRWSQRLLRELSEVDREVREIDGALVRPLLTACVENLIKTMVVEDSRIWTILDLLILNAVLAPVLSDAAHQTLSQHLSSVTVPADVQVRVERFKTDNPVLCGLFSSL